MTGDILILQLDEQGLPADGYFFDLSPGSGPAGNDPTQWLVEAWSYPEIGEWQQVGASVWRSNGDGVVLFPFLSFDGRPPMPGHSNCTDQRRVRVDMRPSWPGIVLWVVDNAISAAGWILFATSGMVGARPMSQATFLGLFAIKSALESASAIGYHFFHAMDDGTGSSGAARSLTDGGDGAAGREAIGSWLYAVPNAMLTLLVWWRERRAAYHIGAYGALLIACIVIRDEVLYRDSQNLAVNVALSFSFTALLLAAILLICRHYVLRRARALVKGDWNRYNDLWNSLSAPGQPTEQMLRELTAVASTIPKAPPDLIRQFQRQRLDSLEWPCSASSARAFVAGPNPSDPVRSLDQLFLQAYVLHPILLTKVKCWAAASEGCFLRLPDSRSSISSLEDSSSAVAPGVGHPGAPPRREGGRKRYVRWSEALEEPWRIKWGKIKSLSRSIEKVSRVYHQDASRLIDLVRQTVIYREVCDLKAGLAAMQRDPDVTLLRIKNRLDPAFNASDSAGYRSVAVNLRLSTPETVALGVDLHVCEVQLILQSMAELASEEGHKHYAKFRNLRGE
mmetsp:Transcript_74915/g.200976  ORF Transcript_74915/g.200976 Transcript_74915/m.200976 type:complete len:564 (-) Transcript_74915:54-1745(-)